MKKITLFKYSLLLAVCLCFSFSGVAQMASGAKARIYAYALTQNADEASATFTFKTNVAATTAKVVLYADGYNDVELTATSTDSKEWTATVDATNEMIESKVVYNWKAVVSAGGVDDFAEISDKTSAAFSFYRSFAVSVDKSPESDYFGRVYVANQYGGTARSNSYPKTVTAGMYTFDADLTALNDGNPYSVDCIGEEKADLGTSPSDMAIAADGRVFVTVNYKKRAKGGVYYIDPATFESSTVLQGTFDSSTSAYTDADGNYVGGAACGIALRGGNDDTQLYVVDQTKYTVDGNTDGLNDYIMRYDMGANNTITTGCDWSMNKFRDSGDSYNTALARGLNALDVTSNGIWAAAQRNSDGVTKYYPHLFYYSEKTGCQEFEVVSGLPSLNHDLGTGGTKGTSTDTRTIGLAVSEMHGLVAYTIYDGSNVNARVLQYTEDENGKITATHLGDYAMTSQGSRSNALDFDYAGNLYSITQGNELMSVYAIPTTNNTLATPAKSSMTVSFDKTAVGIEAIGADDAPVEYYNLQGVKVENPGKGIYIKKQGNKTTKVVL